MPRGCSSALDNGSSRCSDRCLVSPVPNTRYRIFKDAEKEVCRVSSPALKLYQWLILATTENSNF